MAKTINALSFHRNANDVEAVTFIFDLSAEWRNTFLTGAIIDIVGWRQHGHNETYQPAFTQPLMHKQISKQKSVVDLYTEKLVSAYTFTKQNIKEYKK